jgi:hypothetical protein
MILVYDTHSYLMNRPNDSKLKYQIKEYRCKPPAGFANKTLHLLADQVVELGIARGD